MDIEDIGLLGGGERDGDRGDEGGKSWTWGF